MGEAVEDLTQGRVTDREPHSYLSQGKVFQILFEGETVSQLSGNDEESVKETTRLLNCAWLQGWTDHAATTSLMQEKSKTNWKGQELIPPA